MSITLTESAAKRISNQVSANDAAIGLRFAAKESGCSGYSYDMNLAEEVTDKDTIFESYGVKVIVDEKSLSILDGTQIDYVAEGLNQTFKFSNPKAGDHCGCGESFSVPVN